MINYSNTTNLKNLSRFEQVKRHGVDLGWAYLFFTVQKIKPWYRIYIEAHKHGLLNNKNVMRITADKRNWEGKVRWELNVPSQWMMLKPSELVKELNDIMFIFKNKNPDAEFFIRLSYPPHDTVYTDYIITKNKKIHKRH